MTWGAMQKAFIEHQRTAKKGESSCGTGEHDTYLIQYSTAHDSSGIVQYSTTTGTYNTVC